ncbi:ABC transporter permease [Rhizosaccharibacter radicis]|uniref:ABC transporter permease n=1 Tax=Rhizosaccharibacter radicis TaxID=2782605 RepID=A0ABT1W0S7_9PROT|nr:ABC transporter permease [Acetobacteraceae bacterium KSS12]
MSSTTISGKPAVRRPLTPATARFLMIGMLMAIIVAIGALVADRFLRPANLANVFEQATDLALVALGQSLTVLTGGIDLSVGSLISLLSVLTSGLIDGNGAMVLPVCAGVILLGVLVGTLNGCGVVLLKIHPLIVTLGMGAVLQGVALLYTRSPVGGIPDGFDSIAYGRIGGLSVGGIAVLLIFVAVAVLLRRTATGRAIYAVGDDRHAATLLGLKVRRVTILVYAASGLFSALTAIYLVARFGSGQPYTGADYTLSSVTPVVVGGIVLSGGRGNVLGTLLGAYLLALLNNLLNFLHVPTQIQLVAEGLIIMAAVAVHVEREKRA